jgi:uncharacterized membrane protein YozB (DUF420 family)
MIEGSRPTARPGARRPGARGRWLVALPVAFLVLPAVVRLASFARGTPPADAGDVAFSEHAAVGLSHVVLGIVMAVLVPLQLSRRVRERYPRAHRVGGWVFALSAAVTVGSGLVINVVFPPIGGLAKQIAIVVTGLGFAASLVIALRAIVRRDVATHRAFMLRSLAFGLAGGTASVVLFPYYLAFGQPSDTVVALGRWLSLVVDVAIVELVVLRRAPSREVLG